LGGYVGASLGGLTYDKIGFENGTTVVVALQVLLVVVVSISLTLSLIFPISFTDAGNLSFLCLCHSRHSFFISLSRLRLFSFLSLSHLCVSHSAFSCFFI
jgi:hypothetical protein